MEEPRERAERALDELEREVLRAQRLIDDLRRENAVLRQQLAELGAEPEAGHAAHSRWDEERRRWATERQAIADRLRVILGKFQWLEGEA